jgi:hypothetical protein
MKPGSLAAALLVAGLFASPAVAQVNVARAEQACVAAALKLLMLHRQTLSWEPLRDGRGKVIGTKMGMEVKFLGKTTPVTCLYEAATSKAVIEVGRSPGGGGSATVPRTEVIRACTRAAQAQQLLVDNVAAETPIKDRKGKVTGQVITLNVYQAGRPAQVVCEYDYATRNTALSLRRPQLR